MLLFFLTGNDNRSGEVLKLIHRFVTATHDVIYLFSDPEKSCLTNKKIEDKV